MKKRYEEVSQNLAYIQAQLDEHGINAQIQARQLYHDREEVTVHVVGCGPPWAGVATSGNTMNCRIEA
ncbi:putative RNA 2'-O-ribose methyltransferase [Citrobacter koseri]|uniref:Putative RNA 2'-O-ribose methyltransferase n=1 Tax=Citrobacter koseri TaxID=545 RepID=A0A2X2X348_CITKO|nr:putative RNA 2'-O-ribose methyltransferase [Citrobacter koseri]